ncbi:hypothetical protein CFP65_2606 [Kitasatospora sp. MMS16-BH015]|uniref:HNH endonuclease signature motif containing protein n=1 Tax=Kitasatospora sp. MMS16-BH015 TaxID=2018025 RepID=UPI000CA1C987|nr:HNH endonuclease signature motif containing protein [Kitasatospora sp. MMS16-BH015]AUG77431.1 hypothetical protein CFP65_2606 [Kitasatospora sp. MMS16-BH015]
MPTQVKYTQEALLAAAQQAQSIDEALVLLGKEPNHQTRHYLRRRLTAFGIATSHFEQRGTVYTREVLQAAVTASCSLADVMRRLHLRPAGGTHAHIGRRIKAFDIDTSHFTGSGHNRGKPSPRKLPPEEILVQRPAEARRLPGFRIRRALAELGRPELCEGCGTGPEWQGRPLTLEVDHVNGDWSDNRPDNLRLLCPNCHATTDTYCGRNKPRSARPEPRPQ